MDDSYRTAREAISRNGKRGEEPAAPLFLDSRRKSVISFLVRPVAETLAGSVEKRWAVPINPAMK
jgi:hypothetical protein